MLHFYTLWKRQKTKGFLTFSGSKKWNIELKWVNYLTKSLKIIELLCECDTSPEKKNLD